jgi:hypothetical protein
MNSAARYNAPLGGLNRYDEAETFYQQALGIFERALPAGHPKILTCRKNYQIVRDPAAPQSQPQPPPPGV